MQEKPAIGNSTWDREPRWYEGITHVASGILVAGRVILWPMLLSESKGQAETYSGGKCG